MNFNYETSYGQLIGVVRGLLHTYFIRTFSERGISVTPAQWGMLNRLWEKDGIPQIELVKKTFKQKGNVTRMLDLMQKNNWIVREPSSDDRRVFLIYLTEEGRKLQHILPPIANEVLKTVSEGLSEDEIKIFKKILNQMKSNLIKYLND